MVGNAQVCSVCIPSSCRAGVKQLQGMFLGTDPGMAQGSGFPHQSHFRGSVWWEGLSGSGAAQSRELEDSFRLVILGMGFSDRMLDTRDLCPPFPGEFGFLVLVPFHSFQHSFSFHSHLPSFPVSFLRGKKGTLMVAPLGCLGLQLLLEFQRVRHSRSQWGWGLVQAPQSCQCPLPAGLMLGPCGAVGGSVALAEHSQLSSS